MHHPMAWELFYCSTKGTFGDQCAENREPICSDRERGIGITWTCDKFHNCLIGRRYLIETEHKPLVPLLSTKQLDNPPTKSITVSTAVDAL